MSDMSLATGVFVPHVERWVLASFCLTLAYVPRYHTHLLSNIVPEVSTGIAQVCHNSVLEYIQNLGFIDICSSALIILRLWRGHRAPGQTNCSHIAVNPFVACSVV